MLKVKLYPVGKRNQPRYRIVVSVAKSKLKGKYIENLGFYDPTTDPKTIKLKKNRYEYWLEQGAQPTKTVRSLAKKI